MKFEWRTTAGAAVFLAAITAVYWFWSKEDAGSVLLLFGAAAYLLLFSYLCLQWRRRRGIPRAEDRVDAEQADGAGVVGYFPSASIWPAGLGLGATVVGVALIYGSWYWVLGLPLMFGSIIGFAFEADAEP
jgi:hypothetical protein